MELTNQLAIWGGGQLLAYSGLDGKTDFHNGINARTAFTCTGIDVKLPAEASIIFCDQKPDSSFVSGDSFIITTGDATVRGAFVDAHHILIEGTCDIRTESAVFRVGREGAKTLLGVASFYNPAHLERSVDDLIQLRQQWLQGLSIPSPLPELREKTLCKALSIMKTQVMTAEGQISHRWTTPDRWPHRAMWLWDSAFHAIGLRHLDPALAQDAVTAVLDVQADNGFIPHMANPDTCSNITQPPVLALAADQIHAVNADDSWLKQIFPKLKHYLDWDLKNRDSDGFGLVEWFIHNTPECRSGESGLDNSPRFDSAHQLDAVDFNAFISLELELLAKFATILGDNDEKERLYQQHQELNRKINERLWNESLGFYVDYDVNTDQQSPVMAVTGFLPLICGAASPDQAAKLAAHLENPDTFATPFMVPSIAKCDEAHYSKDMWRGPVWINLNWLIIYGLRRYQYHQLADRLAEQTMSEIEQRYQEYGVIFEFYDDRREVAPPQLLRKTKCAPEISPMHQVFHDYGWSATLYTDLVFST